MIERELVWNELSLDSLLQENSEAISHFYQGEGEDNKKTMTKGEKKFNKIIKKPVYKHIMANYNSLPNTYKHISKNKLNSLSDPIYGKLSHRDRLKLLENEQETAIPENIVKKNELKFSSNKSTALGSNTITNNFSLHNNYSNANEGENSMNEDEEEDEGGFFLTSAMGASPKKKTNKINSKMNQLLSPIKLSSVQRENNLFSKEKELENREKILLNREKNLKSKELYTNRINRPNNLLMNRKIKQETMRETNSKNIRTKVMISSSGYGLKGITKTDIKSFKTIENHRRKLIKEKEKEEKLIAETAAAAAQSNSFRQKLAEAIKLASLDDSFIPESPPRRGRAKSSLPPCFFDAKNKSKASKTRDNSQSRQTRDISQSRNARGASQTRLGRIGLRGDSQTRLNKQNSTSALEKKGSPKKIYSSTSAPCISRRDVIHLKEKVAESKPKTASSTVPNSSSGNRKTLDNNKSSIEDKLPNKPRLPSIPTQKKSINNTDKSSSNASSSQYEINSISRSNSQSKSRLSSTSSDIIPQVTPNIPIPEASSALLASSRIFSNDSKKLNELNSLNSLNESLYNLLEAESELLGIKSENNNENAISQLETNSLENNLLNSSSRISSASKTSENKLDISDCIGILKKYEKSKVPTDQGELYNISNTNELLYKSANKIGTNLNKVENMLKSYDELKLKLA